MNQGSQKNNNADSVPMFMKIIYILISVALAYICTTVDTTKFRNPYYLTGFTKFVGFVAASILGYYGAIIGDWVRRNYPPEFLGSGAISDIVRKTWFISPQFIGILLCAALGYAVIAMLLGK